MSKFTEDELRAIQSNHEKFNGLIRTKAANLITMKAEFERAKDSYEKALKLLSEHEDDLAALTVGFETSGNPYSDVANQYDYLRSKKEYATADRVRELYKNYGFRFYTGKYGTQIDSITFGQRLG